MDDAIATYRAASEARDIDRMMEALAPEAELISPIAGRDAMAFDLGDDGRIWRIRPNLRPWLATTRFAHLLIPKVGRHPGLVLRTLRNGRRA